MKYEDLVGDRTFAAWREVLGYLGFEPGEMEPALAAVSAKSLFAGGDHHEFHVTSGAKEQWQQVFDPELRVHYTALFSAELAKLGYPLTAANGAGSSRVSNEPNSAADVAAPSSDLRDQIESKLKQFEAAEVTYNQLIERITHQIATALPADVVILVVSKGDNRLVPPGSKRVWHFPQAGGGLYWNGNPADSSDAIAQLEELRGKGAGFLILPSTEFWWLDYYGDFRSHLDRSYHRVIDDQDCIIYNLTDTSTRVAGS